MPTTGLKVSLDVGEVISGAGRAAGAIEALTEAMKKAHKEGDYEKEARLSFDRDRLQNKNSGFERDAKSLVNNPHFQTQTANGTVFKIDPEYASLLKTQTDAMKRLTAEYAEAIRNGDMAKAHELQPQLEKQQNDFHNTVSALDKPTAGQKAQDAAKAIGAGQVMNAVTDGLSRWVGSLDRSGIVSKQGSGDVIGAQIDETRRTGNLVGGIGQSVLGIGGTIAGSFLGNPILGGMIGSSIGKLIGLPFEAKANEAATNEAYAKNWEQQAPASMELAAVLGRNGGSVEENTRSLREAFGIAASAATAFGYSAEEGIDAIKQAAGQGLSESESVAAAKNVFNYERGTGADRNQLLSLETTTRRYGVNDSLGAAWAGNQASGMSTGQYNEYLRSMQRIFEDGISKGFVRGSKEIAGDLTLVNQMAGGSELWKGEQGQQRLSQMNSALESTTSLSSATDILAFRGAQNVLKSMGDEDWKKMTDLDNNGTSDITRSGDYVDAMLVLERGLTPKLFNAQMGMINNAEGGGRTGSIERMRQMYGLNYTNSAMLYDQWHSREESGNPLTQQEIDELIKTYAQEPPKYDTVELNMFRNVEEIKKLMAQIGQHYTDEKQADIFKSLVEIWQKANALGVTTDPNPAPLPPPPDPESVDTSGKPPIEAEKAAQNEYIAALESGDSDRVEEAAKNLEVVQMEARARMNQRVEDPFDQETRAYGVVGRQTGKMFDEWFGSKEDKTAYKNVNSIFARALSSGDQGEREAALRFSDAIGSMSESDKGAIAKYNKDNTWNALGDAKDIYALLAALERLTEKMDDVNIVVDGDQ